MSILVRAGKNIFFKAIAEILSRFIYLFFFIYMARKLGASDFGLFSFAFSLAGIFAILVEPGLNTLLTRDVSRDRTLAGRYSDNIFTVKTLLSIATFSLLLAYVKLFGFDDRTIGAVLLMGVFLILNGLLDFFVALSNAHERMDIEAVIRVANKLFVSLIGAVALFHGSALNGLLSWMVVGSVAAVLLSFSLVKKAIISIRIAFEWQLIKSMLAHAYPMALTMIFYIIYFKIDVVMLSLFHVSNAEIGYYSASIKLIEILNVIPSIMVGGIFPILANLSEKSPEEFRSIFTKSFKILMLIAIPIVVTTAFLSKEIIGIIYGNGYEKSASALVIVIWTSLFIFPNFLLTNVFIIANKQKLNAIFTLACLLLNIVLNFILIPRYGFIGSSIATVATDALLFLLSGYFASKYFTDLRLFRFSIKPAICGVLLAMLLTVMHGMNAVFLIAASGASYVLLVFITKTLSIDDVLKLKRVFERNETVRKA